MRAVASILGSLTFFISVIAQAIVGGQDVARGSNEARSTALVLFGNQMRCGAAIISPKHILTAAHCARLQPSAYTIVFDNDLSAILKGERKAPGRGVTKIYKHSELAKHDGLSDDLAIMELRGEIPPEAALAKLPEREMSVPANTVLTSLGYGARNNKGYFLQSEPIRLAQKAGWTVEPDPVVYKGIDLSFHRLVISQFEGGICQGDSGGPTYLPTGHEPVLIGINGATVPPFDTRITKPACAANAYVTRVDTALEWINSVIEPNAQAMF